MKRQMRIAVAGLSARMMAEAAQKDGFEVLALDLFGDVDTQRVSSGWRSIGEPAQMRLDPVRTLAALKESRAAGWVAGSGFEAQPQLLAQAAAVLPLLGTAPLDATRLRDPATFFNFLAARDIAHPPWATDVPRDDRPWLLKNPRACGGWHIERATVGAQRPSPHHFFQRELLGQSMSVSFVGNARRARVLGFNEMIVRPVSGRPFVFCGVIGPVPVPALLREKIGDVVQQLTAEFRLSGLCSLDFMRQGEAYSVLEVNARPPASMALYRSTMQAHVQACLEGHLPSMPERNDVRGTEILFARRAGLIDEARARWLAARPDTHDLPRAGTRLGAGDPVCSLAACGESAGAVRLCLSEAREALLNTLETPR